MKALIFDMDGVLIDSEKYWGIDELNPFIELVPDWSEQDKHDVTGKGFDLITPYVMQRNPSLTIEHIIEVVDKAAKEILQKCELMPAVPVALQTAQAMKLRLAIASSSWPEWISIAVERLKLKQHFPITVSGREVEHGKPAPDIYLLAAKRLGVSPTECVVIEDSNNGVASAKAAGMRVIGYANEHNHNYALEEADIVIADFSQLKDALEKLKSASSDT